MLAIETSPPNSAPIGVLVCSVIVRFVPATYAGERARVADISAAGPEVEAHYRSAAGYLVVSDRPPGLSYHDDQPLPSVSEGHGVGGAPAPAARAEATKAPDGWREIALRCGWLDDDLEGVGVDGDLSERGGRSAGSGLTAAQMLACTAPEDWGERREHDYPWDCEDWSPPPGSWATPVVQAKPDRPEPEPKPDDVVSDPSAGGGDPDVDDLAGLLGEGGDDAAGEPGDGEPNEGDPEPGGDDEIPPEAGGDDAAGESSDGGPDPAITAGYLDGEDNQIEGIAKAREIITGMLGPEGLPPRGKANAKLVRAKLPRSTPEQYEALTSTIA